MISAQSILALAAALGALAAVSQDGPPAVPSERGAARDPQADSDDVVEIDGVLVPADEYARWMIDVFASKMASRFAEQWLVRKECREQRVELAPGAVDARIDSDVAERVRGAFLGKREDWLDELRRTGWSEGGYRRYRTIELEPWMLATELTRRDRKVPEELIVRDWELFYGPKGHEYTLSGILVKVEVEMPPDGSGREVYEEKRRKIFAERLARALEVRERALGGEDFAKLAREVSDDPATRADGGRIRAKFRPPGWNEPFVQSLLELGPGAISQPLYAKGGYWIVRVEDLVVTPLEKVRAEIERRLVELGPESFEVGAVWSRITAGKETQLLPAMFEEAVEPESHEPVIGMVIDGEPVPRAAFAAWLLQGRGEHYARTFAEHWLVEREARERGIVATPEEVETRVQEQLQQILDQGYKGSRDAWLLYLRQRGRDEAGWRREWTRRMRIEVLTEKLFQSERKVTDEQVLARWHRIYGEEGKWVEARLILVPLPAPEVAEDMSREDLDRAVAKSREQALATAQGLARRLADGEDFATLARTFSSHEPTRARGGKLEGRFRPDEWPEEVSKAVMALEAGRVTAPLDAGKGFAIFEVLESRRVPFEEVRDAIRTELERERVPGGDLAGYRNVLGNKSTIRVLPRMHAER
jgi:parvulin-like peptidyl-prolyl isomerase